MYEVNNDVQSYDINMKRQKVKYRYEKDRNTKS